MSCEVVIDATPVGGRMRFVNHSCKPNYGFEKLSIRGQERCGVFSVHHIQPGDELIADYGLHYVNSWVESVRL
jgi:SET domain-containing protein